MITQKRSLHKIVNILNNPEEDGGFWLPNIQRDFVWDEDQICRLFDSILREYPISTLLIWKTKSNYRHRKFIDNFHDEIRILDFFVPDNDKPKSLVLDGQQRLQSLYIGLAGSYNGRELYLNVLSGDVTLPDDVKYKFEFLNPNKAEFPWVKFKDLVGKNSHLVGKERDPWDATENIIKIAGGGFNQDQRATIGRNVSTVLRLFHSDEGISYQLLDSIDNPELYMDDDVVEIFIRANSGGTILSKSDLLFSLLINEWDEAHEKMNNLLDELNGYGYHFTRDFILKVCLTLLDQKAQYEVSKFRKPGVRENIEKFWPEITKSVQDVLDFIRGRTYIQSDKALTSYLGLIPLIYFRYHYPNNWATAQNRDLYLLRILLSGAFSGTPDQLINKCVDDINKKQNFNVESIFEIIRSNNKSLELTEDSIWKIGYNTKDIHLLFNLWYGGEHNFQPAYSGNELQIDHIFPQSLLMKETKFNSDSGRNILKYDKKTRDQLANCMLLTREENGAGGKGDTPPNVWFSNKTEKYKELHLIPNVPELWEIERFEDFIEARKNLIKEKFSDIISKSSGD